MPEGRFAAGRHAGTLVPLFSIPSRASWGVGEITDLPLFARWLDSAGFDFVQILPVNEMADGQNSFLYPWPYIEGVTIEEAANDLAFMATGAYDKPVAKQHGAPLRLHLPWKYGFKSIKSIRKISFVEERPVGLWEAIQPSEYGFWANVNPEVPHPRWSQAMERVLHTGELVPTQLFNGYGADVAGLYAGMDPATLYM